MKRRRIRNIHGLIEAGGVARTGAATHGAAIGLHHNAEDKIALNLTEFITKHGKVEREKGELDTSLATLAEEETRAQRLVMEARDSFKGTLGYVHSDNWSMVGLPKSLRVPARAPKLIPMMETMRLYYISHPQLEVASRHLTAARVGELLNALKGAKATVTAKKAALRTSRIERRALGAAMKRRLSSLADELRHLLDADDSRYLDFGFNIPGVEETPDVPQNIRVVLSGAGAAAFTWDRAARATRYRVWKRVAGIDLAWIAVGTTRDIDITIQQLPKNTKIEIAVSAVNNGGESRKSTPLELTIQS